MPTPTDRRDYEVFLRGPVGLNTFAYGTVDAYRAGVQHQGRLAFFPEPADDGLDDFGILLSGGFIVEIVDEEGEPDWPILDEAGDPINDEALGIIYEEY